MEKEKVGEGKGHIIILYRGNLSGRGKRVFAEKGRRRSVCGEEIEEKIGSRKYDGILIRIERELNGLNGE